MLSLRRTTHKSISQNNSIPTVKIKAIKYLTLANLSMLAFKTTKDLALLKSLILCKENLIFFLKSDILYMCGIPMWQLLAFIVLATPAIVINQKDKSKKSKNQ